MKFTCPISALALFVASSGFAANKSGRAVPTFSKDVAPILFDRCVGCHRPGEAGPMPLRTYQEARPWAKSIKQAVATHTMPPGMPIPP